VVWCICYRRPDGVFSIGFAPGLPAVLTPPPPLFDFLLSELQVVLGLATGSTPKTLYQVRQQPMSSPSNS
jgi:hypothetical protein